MPNLNKVFLMGNLTRDPESRTTAKGMNVTAFSLAINRTWHDDEGRAHEEVTYVDIEAWGKKGETIQKFMTRGKPLHVEGRLRLDQWEDRGTHEKRSKMKVVLEEFQFLGVAPSGYTSAAQPAERRGAVGVQAEAASVPAGCPVSDEDWP